MKKKLWIVVIALICSFSVGYAYFNFDMDMKAASAYTVGGNVTAKLGEKGQYPNGTYGSMAKGDKVYIGANTKAGDPMSFILLVNESYNTYQPQVDSSGVYSFDTSVPNVTGWFAMANEVYSNTPAFTTFPPIRTEYNLTYVDDFLTTEPASVLAVELQNANAGISSRTKKLLLSRNLDILKQVYGKRNLRMDLGTQYEEFLHFALLNPQSFFIADRFTLLTHGGSNSPVISVSGGYRLTKKDLSFSQQYFEGENLSEAALGVNSTLRIGVFSVDGNFQMNGITCTKTACSAAETTGGLRLSAELDLSDVVFASGVSSGGSSNLDKVKNSSPSLGSYTNIYTATNDYDKLKLRLLDNSGDHDITFNGIKNSCGDSISAATNKTTIYFDADAVSGTDGGEVNTVSALFFKNNKLAYYAPIEAAKGNSTYALDLNGIDAGDYQIALVNESYNENDTTPADCSALTDFMELTIANGSSDLNFTSNTGLEVGKNVNVGDQVGTISSNNGSSDSFYQIVDDLAYAGESAYVTLGSDKKSVVVNGTALHAGTYHFKIQVWDSNCDTSPAMEIATSVTVNKTNLSVAFDNPSQAKKSIAQATVGWNEPATANPSTGTKVTYAKSGGSVGLINIDPDTGMITYAGSGGYGKVEIKATADDDPTSGYDDYNSADTTKEIVIYREVDGNVTPHANSSDTTNPTFKTSDANVKPNGIIGTITGTLGTPDNGTSGTTTYTYDLKSIDDDNYFSVNPSTGEIKTTADLSTTTGTYHITVTVSDKWSTKDIAVTINVGLAGAEDLKFYETTAAIKAITSKSVKVTDTGVNVYATVKGSSNTNPVTYRLKSGEPTNVIDVHPNSGAVTIKGVGTVVIVAEKAGGSGQADASTELTLTVTAGAQDFIYTDDVGDELPKSGSYYSVYKETYAPSKTFQLYTSGNPTGSTVTYQLKAGSPTDVISVDPSGLVTIQNASLTAQKGKVIVQATSHDPSGNYSDKTIELPIDIDKGTRTIAFADHPITVVSGSGSVAPNILTDGILDTGGNAVIEIDPSEDNSVVWTSDGVTIQYKWNEANGKDIKLHATKPADRNYMAAEADGILHILGADENVLTLNTPSKITYGDRFTIRSTQDDSMSSGVAYSFESDNGVFISAPKISGNKAEFDALANSGNTEITITVTRTADGELPLTKKVKIKVLPKPITITIDDQTKKRLEDNPPLTFQDINPQLVSWGGVKDNVDTSVLRLSTTAKKYSPIGSYPITCKNYTTLNDNYPNYTFTLNEGMLNVKDNGNKDFWDIDDDGCPDLNIQIKDEDGNYTTINGDANDDGIPDYNIDSNGDGKPDLNIDTDKDGKPDVNLVILKEWKPSKCVTLDDIQFASGISAKAEINVDTDGDLIPDIDIDTNGDFKADFNIDTDGDGKANVNIGTVHNPWTPDKDFKYQGFAYDSDTECKPYLNIDTDGDGRPDLNLDLDDDGKPDINIDIDGDFIPDTNIDSTGDGKANINVDTDGDGTPDENIIEITEWKPEHNVDEPLAYDTMKIENKNQLEDNGVTIEKPNGDPFLPNMALKVTDVTEEKKSEVIDQASDLIKEDQEVKRVYDIKLLENGVEVKPDGTLKIRIPISEGYTNPILLKQKETGEYEAIEAKIEDGYLVYESDELGIVAIIADIMEEEPNNEIKGNYYPGNNMGGALTGDTRDMMKYINMGCMSLGLMLLAIYKYTRKSKLN